MWRYDEVRAEELRGDDHSTMPHRGTYEGLKFLFSGWRPPEKLQLRGDLARLEAHYAELSQRVGYPVLPPERLFNNLGYRHLQEKSIPQALAAFERNVALYPDSANAYDSLGEALEAGTFNCSRQRSVGSISRPKPVLVLRSKNGSRLDSGVDVYT